MKRNLQSLPYEDLTKTIFSIIIELKFNIGGRYGTSIER